MAGSGRCDQRQRGVGGWPPCSSGRLLGLDVSAASLFTDPQTRRCNSHRPLAPAAPVLGSHSFMLASLLKRLAILLVANASISRFASLLLAFGLPLPVRVVAYTLVAAIGLVGAIWVWQESILYVPAIPSPSNPALGRIHRPSDCPAGFRSPSERGLPFEDVHLISSDGVKCHAWFFPAPKRESASTILFSHENAGPMSLRLPLCEVLHRSLRCNLLCYDYRGYGDSEQAKIDEAGLMQDAHAAWRWLLDQSGVDPTRIVLFGSSLGGAVTIQLARDLCISQEPRTPLPLGVVLQNTFTSIEAML